MTHKQLQEGMWAGDLADLVQPLISIDEYTSKIDDNSLVIGFYVNDEDAAMDLNRFIQRSAIDLVDCDVSPAPDQRGYYMVFVEMLRNERLVSNIDDLVSEVSPLVSQEQWQMKVRNVQKMIPLDAKKLQIILDKNYLADRIASVEHDIKKVARKLKIIKSRQK